MDSKTKKWMLLQIGLGLVLFIVFLGFLNSLTYSYRVPVITTDSLWNSNVTVTISYRNATTGQEYYMQQFLRNIATYYNGKLYISLPSPPTGYDGIVYIQVFLNNTLGELASHGINYVELYFDTQITPITNTSMTFIGIAARNHWCSGCPFTINNYKIEPLLQDYWYNIKTPLEINKTIDAGLFALKTSAWGATDQAVLFIGGGSGQLFRASYIVLELKLYATSEKPVLKALMEPLYSLFAALYATMLAVIKKVKQILLSAFGGFVSSFTLTGLIGDPVVALILTMIFITIVFLVIKPQKRLRA